MLGRIAEEYLTIAGRAGWIDRRRRGRLRFDGADVAPFLHGLVSNDVAGCVPGEGVYATYLSPQGRLLAFLELYRLANSILAEVAEGEAEHLVSRFDGLIFAEDVQVSDVSTQLTDIEVTGGEAAEVVASTLGVPLGELTALSELSFVVRGDVIVARAGDSVLPSFKIFAPALQHRQIVAGLEAQGALPVSQDLTESLRISAGRPAPGVDMTADTIPLEAGLLGRAVSTTKGCYVGQEVIVRILHRGGGRVARRLVSLHLPASSEGAAWRGAALRLEGQDVGAITSAAWAPSDNGSIALGYVKRDVAEVGVRLEASGPTTGEAVVTDLAR